MTQQPLVGQGFLIEASRSHNTRYHSSGREISPTQRALPDNTKQSQATDTHTNGRWDPRKS